MVTQIHSLDAGIDLVENGLKVPEVRRLVKMPAGVHYPVEQVFATQTRLEFPIEQRFFMNCNRLPSQIDGWLLTLVDIEELDCTFVIVYDSGLQH